MLNPPTRGADGVGTFWELDRSAVSLFTYRSPDVASADREYQRLAAVLDNCRDVPVAVHARPASRGMLTVTPLILDASAPPQISYVLTTNDGTKLAVHVLEFDNTISWQFRYEPVPDADSASDGSARHGFAHGPVAGGAGPAPLGAPQSPWGDAHLAARATLRSRGPHRDRLRRLVKSARSRRGARIPNRRT